MISNKIKQILVIGLMMVVFPTAFGQNSQQQSKTIIKPEGSDITQQDVGVEEKLNQQVAGNVTLVNQQGKKVKLKSLIDKPTILNLVYYECPGICSPLMNGIADFVEQLQMDIGKDYQVLTVSFDHTEGTELASRKHTNYMKMIDREIDETGWTFYTADSTDIKNLTNSVGFKYMKTSDELYAHSSTLVVMSPKGKITRYLNGTYFLPFEVKMSLVEASKGKTGSTINRVLQYCYNYDPKGQKYVLNITKITGTFMIFIAVIVFLVLVVRTRKKNQTPKPNEE